MSIQINFELSDDDLEHFREMMREAIKKASNYTSEDILKGAKVVCAQMDNATLPEFVAKRFESLKKLIEAVEDAEWQMPDEEKSEVLTTLAYFTEPQDLVPDHIPGLGFIDDAIMIELVIQDLSQDLEAYGQFCQYRVTEESRRGDSANVNRESWLEGKRTEIRSNLRRRRKSSSRSRVFSRVM